ncbi:MAG: hypothetical protein MJZ36_06860 [Bacteroidaceae bacterium]|nr:hypothetical protein [Bacteroidaceae bacterium]
MKKNYIKPTVLVIAIEEESVIADSGSALWDVGGSSADSDHPISGGVSGVDFDAEGAGAKAIGDFIEDLEF